MTQVLPHAITEEKTVQYTKEFWHPVGIFLKFFSIKNMRKAQWKVTFVIIFRILTKYNYLCNIIY